MTFPGLEECKGEAARLKLEYEGQMAAFAAGGSGPAPARRRAAKKKEAKKAKKILVQEASGEKPKRARTAYLIFCDGHRDQIMKEMHSAGRYKLNLSVFFILFDPWLLERRLVSNSSSQSRDYLNIGFK